MANWWQTRPLRLVQTNLRQIDVQRDPREIVQEVADFGANAILFSVGGIVSFYPSQLAFQTPIPGVSDDFVGQAVEEAHRLNLRFIARLDLSKCHKHVYDHHPTWFFRRADGQPQVYNGLYSTCINGGYYRRYAFKIIQEVIDRYEINGFFFNMFGYHTRDYSGREHGLCHCVNCQRRMREMFGHGLPASQDPEDPAYRDFVAFRRQTVDEVSRAIGDYIHAQDKGLAFVTGASAIKYVDILRSESNTAVDRPLPRWAYSGSDNVKRLYGTCPEKVASNTTVYFLDIPYRFAAVSPHLTALRLAQNLAHGGGVDLYVLGTLEQADKGSLSAARDMFAYLEDHEDTYQALTSLAKTCLLIPQRSYDYGQSVREEYRGLYRLLAEQHVPFDTMFDWALEEEGAKRLSRYDLVVLPDAACLSDVQSAVLDAFVREGGAVLATGATGLYDGQGAQRPSYGLACLGAEEVIMARQDMRSAYIAVAEADPVGSLADTGLLFLDGRYLYIEAKDDAKLAWSLVPPCMYGPPEKVFLNKVETSWPGAIRYAHGQGRSVYVPWELGRLYYTQSSPAHAKAFAAILAWLGGERLAIETNAHPAVEVGIFSRSDGRYLCNLVNSSGYQGTAFFAPIPMVDISLTLNLPTLVTSAQAVRLGAGLEIQKTSDTEIKVRLPRLDLFESIVLTVE